MKKIIFFFLCSTVFLFGKESIVEKNELKPLRSLLKFDLLVFYDTLEDVHIKIYDSVRDSFQRFCKTEVTSVSSIFSPNLLGFDNTAKPTCLFTISKRTEYISITMQVLVDAEILANKCKIFCPIWEQQTLQLLGENTKEELIISELCNELIDKFYKDWKNANPSEKQQISIHMTQFMEILPSREKVESKPISFPLEEEF